MSLTSALQIGRSGLLASQAAIQVTGNNISNVAVAGYHRQTVNLQPAGDQQIQQGIFMGRGVQLQSIVRQVSESIESRLRDSQSDQAGNGAHLDILTQIESISNELSDNDLSTQLSSFFNAWSELANNPSDDSLRQVVIQQGNTLSSYLNDMYSGLSSLRSSVDTSITQDAQAANDLLNQIAGINQQIIVSDSGTGQSSALRDQRDSLLSQLSQFMDISTNQQSNGAIDVFVGSLPIIQGAKNRGLAVQTTTDKNGQEQINLVIADDRSVLNPQSGSLGAKIASRKDDVQGTLNAIDDFASQLISQVNRVHSQGQGTQNFSSLTSASAVEDTTAALNDPAAGLAFSPTHGSFKVYLTQKSTGQRVESTIHVDLDGIGADSSLSDIAAALNGVDNLSATITPDNHLLISANGSDYQFSFGQDTSGLLAAMGINTFFTGSQARDIAVNQTVQGNPALIAASQNGSAADNSNALGMARLGQQSLIPGKASISQQWEQHVQGLAIKLNQTKQQLDASTVVTQNLQSQQQSYSGVNIDEETINLLAFQRAYQGSARFLSVVDDMMQTLMQLI